MKGANHFLSAYDSRVVLGGQKLNDLLKFVFESKKSRNQYHETKSLLGYGFSSNLKGLRFQLLWR